MENVENTLKATISPVVQNTLPLVALQAIMISHPNPRALREAWQQRIEQAFLAFQLEHLKAGSTLGNLPHDVTKRLWEQERLLWEGFLPEVPAAPDED